MTYSVTDTRRENAGSYHELFATIDVTSLSNVGHEVIDPSDFGLSDIFGVSVEGQENAGYLFTWNHSNDNLSVAYADYDAAADGALIDVPAATDVGEVVLSIKGR